jgi:hypothetical protein
MAASRKMISRLSCGEYLDSSAFRTTRFPKGSIIRKSSRAIEITGCFGANDRVVAPARSNADLTGYVVSGCRWRLVCAQHGRGPKGVQVPCVKFEINSNGQTSASISQGGTGDRVAERRICETRKSMNGKRMRGGPGRVCRHPPSPRLRRPGLHSDCPAAIAAHRNPKPSRRAFRREDKAFDLARQENGAICAGGRCSCLARLRPGGNDGFARRSAECPP